MTVPPWIWPRSAYIHIPFCAHRCGYCDFAIAIKQEHHIDRYLAALDRELTTLGEPQPVETLFLGGGTPSHLPFDALRRLLKSLAHWLPLQPGHEYSIEANPESLDADKVALLADHGVNRISLGAQSFDANVLRVLDRRHDPAEVARALVAARRRIEQVSLDLIFGVPGQTLADWQADLGRALDLGTDHLSTYGLTYEEQTPLWKRRQRGLVMALSEDQERDLYACSMDRLESAGFEHYEISNFARPGARSRHNQVYWANEAYFGFGMGAARYVRGTRELNTRRLAEYLERIEGGASAVVESEELPPRERSRETMAVQLRRCEGIDRRRFQEQTGFALDVIAGPRLPILVNQGLLSDDGERVWLTRAGKFVADGVIENLL